MLRTKRVMINPVRPTTMATATILTALLNIRFLLVELFFAFMEDLQVLPIDPDSLARLFKDHTGSPASHVVDA